MGKSSGGPSSQTNTGPWGPSRKYLRRALPYWYQLLTGIGGKPFAPYNFPDQQVAGINPTEQAGLNLTTQMGEQEASAESGAPQQISDTLSGKYLDPATNPWLNKTFNEAAQQQTNAYETGIAPSEMTGAIQAGAFGGSADAEARAGNEFNYGQDLSNLATQIYGGNYQQERQNQLDTLGNLGKINLGLAQPGEQVMGAGGFEQSQAQNELQAQYENAYARAAFPYQLLSMYTGGIEGIGSQGGTSFTQESGPQGPSALQEGIGGALSLAPLLFLL